MDPAPLAVRKHTPVGSVVVCSASTHGPSPPGCPQAHPCGLSGCLQRQHTWTQPPWLSASTPLWAQWLSAAPAHMDPAPLAVRKHTPVGSVVVCSASTHGPSPP